MQVFGRSHEVTLGGEVRGVDHQSFAVPSAARVASPLADVLRKMRPPVERNDARFVDHLREKHHVFGSLENLVVTVGSGAEVSAQPRDAESDAANKIGQILRSSWRAFRRFIGGGLPALRRWR